MNVPVLPPKAIRKDEREEERSGERETRPVSVFGDSTPFPYGGNYIEAIRHAVECGVSLMNAQHTIVRAGARLDEVERARQAERTKLEAMHLSLRRTVTADVAQGPDRLQRTGARILDATRVAIDAAVVQLEATAAEEMGKARTSKDEARVAALRAVERFLLHHDLPGTHVGLRMIAGESSYSSHALVAAPFGVEAMFELLIPDAHEWGRVRQVRDLAAGIEMHVPLESGLIWKKVEVLPAKLDKLFLSSIHMAPTRSVLVLRKQPTTGAGYKIEIEAARLPARVTVIKLLEDGSESPEPALDISDEDATNLLRLSQRVQDSTAELASRRTVISSAMVDGRAMLDLDEPQLVCERLIRTLAPTVREIARRSGAPGELVLRRDIRAGRRDEVYITKAELFEKVCALPSALRTVFEPLELDGERSPRAPEPSIPSYDDLPDSDVELLGHPSPPLLPPHRASTRPPAKVA